MARVIRKIKEWFEFHGRKLAIGLVFAGVVGVGVWHASTTHEEVIQEDFGDARISAVAHEVSNLDYEDGLRLLAEGEMEKGRAVMQRLAPLLSFSEKAQGNAKAHLWSAKDLLQGKAMGFLGVYPVEAAGGKRLASPVDLKKEGVTDRCQRHLESAVALDSNPGEAYILLAEVFIAQGKRNEAIESLHHAVEQSGCVELGLQLANALSYQGDDIGLEEAHWHALATLDRKITGSKRSDIGVRADYIFHALALKQFDLAKSAIEKLDRDFNSAGEATEVMAQVRASQFYFQALALLEEEDFQATKAAELLLQAHRVLHGKKELVQSLKALVEAYPTVKPVVAAGIGEVSLQMEQHSPVLAADLHVFLAELKPESARAHLLKAYQLNSSDPRLVVAWVQYNLQGEAPDLAALEAELKSLIDGLGENVDGHYELLVALGKLQMKKEDWYAALEAFEPALTLGRADSELHQLLGETYAALGKQLIADEHLQLASQ